MYSVKYWLSALSLVLTVTEVVSQDNCSKVGVTSTLSIAFGNGNEEIPANLGNPIDLRCDAILTSTSGNVPSINRYVWEQNGIDLQVNSTLPNYRISSVQSSDGGEYRCAAVTDSCVTSFSSTRVVSTRPTITGILTESQNVVERDSLTLTCQAPGWPTPDIMWFKVGSNDTLVNITAGPQLIITSTSLSDAGEYVCQANNHRGDAEERIQINIEPEPTNPTTELETEEPTTQAPVETTETEVVEPTPKVEFYVAVAVAFAVCFSVALLVVIMSIVGICVVCKRDNRGEGAPENEDEEDLVEMETLETAMPKPKKKKNRAKQKF